MIDCAKILFFKNYKKNCNINQIILLITYWRSLKNEDLEMFKQKLKGAKGIIKGQFRNLEITFHPHFHVIFLKR